MSVTSRIRPMLIRTVFFLQWPILSSAIILTSPSESSHIPRSSSPAVCSLTRQSVSVYSLWTDMCLIERNQHRLNKTNLLTAHSFGLTPYYDPHFPAPHDKHADPRLFLPCAVKPQTKLCSVCESKTDLFHLHCSFYSLRLSSFHTLSFSSFLPSPIRIYFCGPFYKLPNPLRNTLYSLLLKSISLRSNWFSVSID